MKPRVGRDIKDAIQGEGIYGHHDAPCLITDTTTDRVWRYIRIPLNEEFDEFIRQLERATMSRIRPRPEL